MTTPDTCPAHVKGGRVCGRPGRYDGYCGHHQHQAPGAHQTSGGEPSEEPAGTGYPTGSKPGASTEQPSPPEPHPAPDLIAEATAPRPAPPTSTTPVPSRGSVRRLRGLTRLGYTPRQLARTAGLSDDAIWWLLIAPPDTILGRTRATIDDTYRRLRVTPLDGPTADRARGLAARHVWPSPYDWEDIDRDEHPPHHGKLLNEADLLAAVADASADEIDTSYATDDLINARAETGRVRVELEALRRDLDTARTNTAADHGRIDALTLRLQRALGEASALRDQLEAANTDRDRLLTEADTTAQRLAELETQGTELPLAGVELAEAVELSGSVERFSAGVFEDRVTIDVDASGIHITLPPVIAPERPE